MGYTIKSFISSDGERFSQLYDTQAGGVLLYYPTAYIASSVRQNATHDTQRVYLEALTRHLGQRRKGNANEDIGRGKYNTYVAYAAD